MKHAPIIVIYDKALANANWILHLNERDIHLTNLNWLVNGSFDKTFVPISGGS